MISCHQLFWADIRVYRPLKTHTQLTLQIVPLVKMRSLKYIMINLSVGTIKGGCLPCYFDITKKCISPHSSPWILLIYRSFNVHRTSPWIWVIAMLFRLVWVIVDRRNVFLLTFFKSLNIRTERKSTFYSYSYQTEKYSFIQRLQARLQIPYNDQPTTYPTTIRPAPFSLHCICDVTCVTLRCQSQSDHWGQWFPGG